MEIGPKNFKDQLRVLIIIDGIMLAAGLAFAWFFWHRICEISVVECLTHADLSIPAFLGLCLIRPFVFTPSLVFTLMAANTYGPFYGSLLASAGSTLSTVSLYFFGKLLGLKIVNPWLASNLPQTLRFLRSQDYKLVLALRMVPLVPFDLFSFLFGLVDFRVKRVFIASFIGYIPQAYILGEISNTGVSISSMLINTLFILFFVYFIPVAIFEYRSRKRGSSMARRLYAMWNELTAEITTNNQIKRQFAHDPNKTPVLLLYGFFSSRRALVVMERILTKKGYEVFSFNMGGIFGVFFTRSVTESAHFLEYKLKRQIDRHSLDKINIVAHSKGGLVALWYILKLGGSRYCDKLITMGSPFGGSIWTWAALVTPIGLLFRDVWQMRPGSELIKEINKSKLPRGLKVYNFYSNRDWIAHGRKGILQEGTYSPQIVPVPMHHITHFDFLSSREVGDALAYILGSPYKDDQPQQPGFSDIA